MMLRTAAVALLAASATALPQVERRALQTQATPFQMDTNGAAVSGEIVTAAQGAWFTFNAISGATYQIETICNSLADTVMDLLQPNGQDLIVENDDDSRDSNSYASYVEWTCPADGAYMVLVKGYGRATGTFSLSVTMVGGGIGGVGGGDPCNGGAILDVAPGTITFQPNGNYGDNAACQWSIECANGQPPELSFTAFDTEADYDFITLHEGHGTTDPVIGAQMSGGLSDLPGRSFHARGDTMTVEFSTDDSVTAGGFACDYRCGTAAPPPPPARPPPPSRPPPPPTDAHAAHNVPEQAQPANINAMMQGSILTANDHQWFSFPATAGDSFAIEVSLAAPATLSDSVLDIVDTDRRTVLLENDDDDRAGSSSSYASYVDWTAPTTGTFYIMVKAYSDETGTYMLTVTPTGSAGGAGDPCTAPGVTLTNQAATIAFTPNGGTLDNQDCVWTITCSYPNVVVFNFDAMATEQDYDFVTLYDGPNSGAQLDSVSGNLIDLAATSYASTQSTMTVEFLSDESVGGDGFTGSYTCGGPPPPPPRPPPGPPPPPTVGPAPPPDVIIDTGHMDRTMVTPDGTMNHGEVQQVGDQEWFMFHATGNVTYQVETQLGTLDDTIIDLIDTDQSTVIVENDDDDRGGGTLPSCVCIPT